MPQISVPDASETVGSKHPYYSVDKIRTGNEVLRSINIGVERKVHGAYSDTIYWLPQIVTHSAGHLYS